MLVFDPLGSRNTDEQLAIIVECSSRQRKFESFIPQTIFRRYSAYFWRLIARIHNCDNFRRSNEKDAIFSS